jgi:hypothetical protein
MATSHKVEVKLPADSSIEWVRLAAYIDGEGYIEIVSRDKGTQAHSLKLSIGNTDPRLIVWLQDTFGGSTRRRLVTKATKMLFEWRVNGVDVVAILENCLPHFIMKRDQAEVAIVFGRLMGPKCGPLVKGRWVQSVPPETQKTRTALMFKLREVRNNSCERVA